MNSNTKTILKTVIGTLAAVALSVGAWEFGPKIKNSMLSEDAIQSNIVVLDPVKLANAQRAVASGLLGDEVDVSALKLRNMSEDIDNVVREIAGDDAIILVKQAVMYGNLPDITNDVLVALRLPLNTPTVDPTNYLDEVAPTDLGLYARSLMQDKITERSRNEQGERATRLSNKALEALLP